MPDTTIIKLKIRRGTDTQRKSVILEEGELGYTTDTQRVFIGDGVTLGGITASTKVFTPVTQTISLTGLNSQVGDLAIAGSIIYQLTAADFTTLDSWVAIGAQPDNSTIQYTGTPNRVLTLKPNSIGSNSFNISAAYSQGGIIATPSNGLSANIDGTYVVLSSNYITISKLSADKIHPNTVGAGLEGGDGVPLYVNVDPSTFTIDGNNLITLTNLPSAIVDLESVNTGALIGAGLTTDAQSRIIVDVSSLEGFGLTDNGLGQLEVDVESLYMPGSGIGAIDGEGFYVNLPQIIGNNLTIDSNGRISATVPVADGVSILNSPGGFTLAPVTSAADSYWKTLNFNAQGQITGFYSSILDTLTGNSATTSPLSVFNGSPNQIELSANRTNQSLITAVSSVEPGITRNITLTSAGFITFENTDSLDGTAVGRFAIPIYSVPLQ